MKRIAAVVAMATLMSVSLGAVATAHTVRFDPTITFQVNKNGQKFDTFEGKVLSDRCVARRRVLIFRVVEGGDDKAVREGYFTNAHGRYSISANGDVKPGTYYALVTRKVRRKGDGHRHVCKGATSNERVVAETAA